MKIRKVKVDDLFWTPYTAQDYKGNYLSRLFLDSTSVQGETVDGFFNKIWVPVKVYNEQTGKFADDYTYYNCGMDTNELAQLYWTKYSGNFLIGGHEDFDGVFQRLVMRCESIFKQYLGKYRKLVEMEGLIWNPLWNVDGTELHQILEVHGNENDLFSESGASATGKHLKDTRKVTPYDGDALKTESEEDHVGQDTSTPSASATYGTDSISSSGGQVSNADTTSSEARASRSHRTHDAIGYGVSAEDTAFGTAISDGDLLHTEKTVRQGNIGVTKTTELIEDARKTVAYSIIQEFFKDINKVILIGTYDN